MASAAEATGTSNSGWDRHLGLFAGPRDPSRGIANCARRSLNEGPLDPGSIPGSSTTRRPPEHSGGVFLLRRLSIQAIQTVLILQNSRMPWAESSRP
ncbi:Uncharacterised protein [Mycobacteroides abscessus subsp. abscessus]|nr:Uncharacterised protein [Mycobacteroides abscessus subsp. abscessus]